MHLSVVIPAYNEELRLPRTLRSVDEYLKKQSYEYEIIVVDGGSTDRTSEIVRSLAREIQNLKLVQTENKGKGYAVKQGMNQAQGEYRVFMDADNSTTVDHVERMWPEFEKGYDVVIGSRDIKGAVIAVEQPLWRKTLGNIFNIIVQIMSGLWGVWDTQCGFKGFTKKASFVLFQKSVIEGWAFDVELLMIARTSRFKIQEVPVTWKNDAESKVRFSGMVKMLFEVFATRWNVIKGAYG